MRPRTHRCRGGVDGDSEDAALQACGRYIGQVHHDLRTPPRPDTTKMMEKEDARMARRARCAGQRVRRHARACAWRARQIDGRRSLALARSVASGHGLPPPAHLLSVRGHAVPVIHVRPFHNEQLLAQDFDEHPIAWYDDEAARRSWRRQSSRVAGAERVRAQRRQCELPYACRWDGTLTCPAARGGRHLTLGLDLVVANSQAGGLQVLLAHLCLLARSAKAEAVASWCMHSRTIDM